MGKRILLIQYVSALLWDWVFLTLHVGEIPIIYDLRGDSQLVPAPCIATQKASVGMHVIITAILVCALFDTAIPTSSFNFCYCSFLIALWAIINISQYYYLAWFPFNAELHIGQDYVHDFVHCPVPYFSMTLSMNNTVYVSVECSVWRTSKVQINDSIALGYDPLQWQHQKYGIVYT